jgi:hypothetical protein
MGGVDAGVDNVRVYRGSSPIVRVGSIEGQVSLISTVKAPGGVLLDRPAYGKDSVRCNRRNIRIAADRFYGRVRESGGEPFDRMLINVVERTAMCIYQTPRQLGCVVRLCLEDYDITAWVRRLLARSDPDL